MWLRAAYERGCTSGSSGPPWCIRDGPWGKTSVLLSTGNLAPPGPSQATLSPLLALCQMHRVLQISYCNQFELWH